jgi:regulator of replication initiation timing
MTSMTDGRRADSARRRERVLNALDVLLRGDEDITVSGLARAARVDRTYLYRHRDLLERVHAAAAAPPEEGRIAAVSRASLRADLTNALERNRRLTVRVRQLEKRLSESLGETAWKESGLGASADIDQLQRRITLLEQDLADIKGQLDERTEELDAARAANRELTR